MIISRKRASLLFLSGSLFIASCDATDGSFEKTYYDVNGLFQQTIDAYTKSQPTFTKYLTINNKTDTSTVQTVNWEKELEVFRQADLNKRDYLNKYTTEKNDNQIVYRLKPGEKSPVEWLQINLSGDGVTSLDAELKTENFLYNSLRKLHAEFSNDLVTTYRVDGQQQLFVGDTEHYAVEARKENRSLPDKRTKTKDKGMSSR